jgi:hypothetical protein
MDRAEGDGMSTASKVMTLEDTIKSLETLCKNGYDGDETELAFTLAGALHFLRGFVARQKSYLKPRGLDS